VPSFSSCCNHAVGILPILSSPKYTPFLIIFESEGETPCTTHPY
jgi:hypothetical protein